MRRQYEMTEEDLERILKACQPTPVMYLTGGIPMGGSPQQNANAAWEELGKQMGFEWDTVEPTGEGNRFFTAIPLVQHEEGKP